MTPLAYAGTALIDASLVIALYDEDDEYYPVAREFFERHSSVLTWCALRVTGWEVFTRLRYSVGWDAAVRGYEFVRQDRIAQLDATPEDESNAWAKLHKYREHKLSFIDALCSTVALRHGVYRVATLDADFEIMGHEVLPPGTTKRERRRQRRRGDQYANEPCLASMGSVGRDSPVPDSRFHDSYLPHERVMPEYSA